MVHRLAKLAQGVHFESNPYLNDLRVPWFERLLAAEPNLRERVWGRAMLARERLRSGDTRRAVDELRALVAEGPRALGAERYRGAKELLALAWLRLAELDNCVDQHSSQSCLFPIQGGGLHGVRRGAEGAKALYLDLLRDDPANLSHRWLLNLAAMTLGEHPDGIPARWVIPASAFDSEHDVGRFPDVAPPAGLAVTGLAGGVVTEDLDGDGHLDLLVSSWGRSDPLRLFINGGDGRWTERSKEAGLEGLTGGINMVHADYDNDGDVDVLVLRGAWMRKGGRHPNSLLRNEGGARFVDATEEAGLLTLHPTQTAAWADFDRDGHLDLFVGNESTPGDTNPSELFHNNGDGTFSLCEPSVGAGVRGFVKAVVWGDYDNDGDADLYISRLEQSNILLRNEGPHRSEAPTPARSCGWRFQDVSVAARVQDPVDSFPAWFWDVDNDGWLDLFVSGWGTESDSDPSDVAADALGVPHEGELPRLFRNGGDGSFSNIARQAGLNTVLLTMGCNFGDLDNDGWLDFYVATGEPDFRVLVPNRMFRNDGGQRFQDVTTSGGFGHLQKGHGVAFADLDNDGDQDVYAVMGGAYTGDTYPNVLFENPGHGNKWVTLRLTGVRSNRSAIGARVRVHVRPGAGGPTRVLHRVVSSGGSFGSSSLQLEVGLGRAAGIPSIEVDWPSGQRQRWEDVPMERIVALTEGDTTPVLLDLRSFDLSPRPVAP